MSLNSTLGKVYTNPNGTMSLSVSQAGPPNILKMRISSSNIFYSEFTFNAPAPTRVANMNITPPVFFTNPIIFNQTNNTFSLGGQQFRPVLAPPPSLQFQPVPIAPVPPPSLQFQPVPVPLPVPIAPFLSRRYQGLRGEQLIFTSTYGQMSFSNQPMTYNYFPSTNELIVKSNTGIKYLFTYNTTKDRFTDNSGGEFYEIIREANGFSFSRIEQKHGIPSLKIEQIDVLPENFDKTNFYFDSEKIKGQLKIRFWQKGDRMNPIGIKGSKLISDIITNAKIPNSERRNQLVICDDEKILACIGLCIDRRAIATKSSTIIRVSL